MIALNCWEKGHLIHVELYAENSSFVGGPTPTKIVPHTHTYNSAAVFSVCTFSLSYCMARNGS